MRATNPPLAWRRGLCLLSLLLACGAGGAQTTATPIAPAADSLQARFAAVRAQSGTQLSDRPVYLRSTEQAGRLQGDVYALVDHPYAALRETLARPGAWCGILILHLNVKYCRAGEVAGRAVLDVGLGRKFEQPLSQVQWVRFEHRVLEAGPDHLHALLQAPTGPLSTSDFRIELEAVAGAEQGSIVRLGYGYAYGLAARLATQAYLTTIARDKVGFSIVGRRSDGQPKRADGLRGVLERNTVRYYLALEVFLDAAQLPAQQQLQASLERWFAETERHALQLHEIERDEYLAMKLREVQRQQTTPPSRRP